MDPCPAFWYSSLRPGDHHACPPDASIPNERLSAPPVVSARDPRHRRPRRSGRPLRGSRSRRRARPGGRMLPVRAHRPSATSPYSALSSFAGKPLLSKPRAPRLGRLAEAVTTPSASSALAPPNRSLLRARAVQDRAPAPRFSRPSSASLRLPPTRDAFDSFRRSTAWLADGPPAVTGRLG